MVSLFAYYYHVQYLTLLGLFIFDRNYNLPKTTLTLFHNVGMEIQNKNSILKRKQILYFKTTLYNFIMYLSYCIKILNINVGRHIPTF